MLCHLFISHVLSALYYSQLTRAALLMQEPDPWSKYSSRERNVIDTLAETETDTYMLIRSGGGGATIGSIDGYVFTTILFDI